MWVCYKSITFLILLNLVFVMNQIATSAPMGARSSIAPENSSKVTLGSLGKEKLERIYKVIGQENNFKEAAQIFDLMSGPWADYSRDVKWENSITDDISPFEFSVVFRGSETTPIVRFLIEPQEFPLNIQSNWKAGLALKEKLKTLPSVDVSKLDKILNIFSPPTAQNIESHFSIWYATILEPNKPLIKVYLNPQIQGEEKTQELVKKAFSTLNSEYAWKFVSDRVYSSKNPSKILYFSLDLLSGDKARTKVYMASKSLKDVEAKLQGCLNYVSGSASKWVKTLTNKDVFDKKPIQITYNFTSEHDRPGPTIHIPVRSYTENDEKAVERLNDFLSPEQIKTLKAIITAISGSSLKDEKALTYVSFRPSAEGQLDVYCYIAPCIYNKKESKK